MDEKQELSMIEQCRAVVDEILRRKLASMPDKDEKLKTIREEFMAGVFSKIINQRYTALFDQEIVNKIWSDIRTTQQLYDFVLDSTSELMLRTPGGHASFKSLTEAVAHSYSCHALAGSAVDEALLTRMPNKAIIQPLLNNNPWLIFCILLSTVI